MIELAQPIRDVPASDRRCASCGYGIATPRVLPLCPMCGSAVWVPPRPQAHDEWRGAPRSATVRLRADRTTL